ncbi:hypothetical protein [Citrobacter sp. RHBSTW-00678]|uniref:hypothetical protein n=1 Tax=Citrobacter sp. RHBSTW-00678 TaxID=2742661 RepID=UPI002E136A62
MSTITRELAKLFRKITNSEIDAEGNAHVVLSPADSLLINNARIALASLEAEAVACIDRANLDYLESGADADVWPASGAGSDDVLLYAAPQLPQPAVVSDEMIDTFEAEFRRAFEVSPEVEQMLEIGYQGEKFSFSIRDAATWWKLGRAAILQAGNHTEQHLDMVVHSGDDNEKADCRLPFDQWLSQQNEPIDVDCGCVTTEAFYHWLRVAYEASNSPVAPDGYVLVPKEPTAEMINSAMRDNETGGVAEIYDLMITAAPQQEVK